MFKLVIRPVEVELHLVTERAGGLGGRVHVALEASIQTSSDIEQPDDGVLDLHDEHGELWELVIEQFFPIPLHGLGQFANCQHEDLPDVALLRGTVFGAPPACPDVGGVDEGEHLGEVGLEGGASD